MQKIGTMDELRNAGPLKGTVGKTKVLVFLVEDSPVATQARCPHAFGPLHEGELCDKVLTCPWHGWSFNLITGQCEEDEDLFIERYQVKVEGEDIFVSV